MLQWALWLWCWGTDDLVRIGKWSRNWSQMLIAFVLVLHRGRRVVDFAHNFGRAERLVRHDVVWIVIRWRQFATCDVLSLAWILLWWLWGVCNICLDLSISSDFSCNYLVPTVLIVIVSIAALRLLHGCLEQDAAQGDRRIRILRLPDLFGWLLALEELVWATGVRAGYLPQTGLL